MQKIRDIFTYSIIFLLVGNIFFPLWASFAWEDKYDYSEFVDKINNSFDPYLIEKNISLDSPRTTFFLRFPYRTLVSDDIEVEWLVDGRIYTRRVDIDDRKDGDDMVVSTFPFVTKAMTSIRLRIRSAVPLQGIELVTSNQDSIGKSLSFLPGSYGLYADSGSPHIISRSEWWADESLRYIPETTRAKRIEEWIIRWKTPLIIEETPAENKMRQESDTQYNALASLNPDANMLQSIERYDGIHKLRWPIEHTKKVDRIIIHHTAENLMQDADDKTLLRAIYLYHTKTKWWWDIGYNFVVWQRGDIYEWRAGGDYTKSAHAYANNAGTVGISLIGNYDTLHLNKDQKYGMIEAITYVVKKYGINLREEWSGIKTCRSWENCIWKKNITLRLSGHMDVWSTSCPWENLHKIFPEIINTVVWKVWYIQPVYNNSPEKKDPIDPEDLTLTVIKDPSIRIDIPRYLPSPPVSLRWKTTKIKLSYPHDSITLRSGSDKKSILRMDWRILPFGVASLATVTQEWATGIILRVQDREYRWAQVTIASDIVSFPSWDRVPLWDTNKKYNDNVFRGKILVRNNNGRLLVINELPIEDYLRWLWEVSDSDLGEKIKTIVVAARTYIYYYTDPTHRKYDTLLYDGSDNPDEFQKYLGYSYELRSPRVSDAVDATRGEVIMFKKKLIKPWYFSSSSGRTFSYKEYCESTHPGKTNCEDISYLQSVDDPAGLGKNQFGHGVGISGIGATYGAAQGKSYKDIISYYLKWVEIRQIKK